MTATGFDTQKKTVALFDNIVDTVDGNADADVATGKIAPGTTGKVDVSLNNQSEVSIGYTLTAKLTTGTGVISKYKDLDGNIQSNGYIPLEFVISDSATAPTSGWKQVSSTTNEVKISSNASNKITAGQTKPLYIHWRWAFENGSNDADKKTNNGLDTAIGEIMQFTPDASNTVTAEAAKATNNKLPDSAIEGATFTLPSVDVTLTATQED